MKALRTLITLTATLVLVSCIRDDGPWHDGTPLTGVISLKGSTQTRELRCGYNYEMLRRYAKSTGRTSHIRLEREGENILDSLRAGRLDVVCFPLCDSLRADSTLLQVSADSCGVWVFASGSKVESEQAAGWIKGFRSQSCYPVVRQPFFDVYNPMKRISADFISPYDSLLRVYADTLGWDWKLLAAVVYQESKFHIEVRSPRGAAGLMQLIPDTAEHFGCRNTLDPEENIRAGVKMLMAVGSRFRKVAASPGELTQFTLAGYNAGTGRVRDCINYARHLGADVSRWENIAAVIPDMKHDSIAALDTIKYGNFYGGWETVSYVRKVRAYHERYRHICP